MTLLIRAPERRAVPSRHGPVAQLLIALSPLSAILVAYAAAAWVNAPISTAGGPTTNRFGIGLHVAGPARVDEAVFGAVPSVWLQHHLVDGAAHWWDAVAALVYVTHFVAIPVVTVTLWFRRRSRFRPWVASVLAFTVVGIGGYVAYPAAPPWLAADRGVIGPVHRTSVLGWDPLGLEPLGRFIAFAQSGSSPVAAMPSLHAGAALLVALALWPLAARPWRVVLAAYVLAMALTLVLTGEHYVVDVVAGWLTAVVAVALATVVARRTAADGFALTDVGTGRHGRARP